MSRSLLHMWVVPVLVGGVVAAANPTGVAPGKALPAAVATVEGITEYRLANGLRVLLFPDPGKPTVTVNVTYLVGSRHESYGETGMAHLLEHLLFKGTPRHPEPFKELSERGARSNGHTTFDRTNYFETLPSTDENLRWALEMEADRMVHNFVTTDPKRATDLLKTEMTVVRNEYEAGENEPIRVLYKRLLAAAYDWHNYGKLPIGAKSDIERVGMDRLGAFYRTYYQPDNAVLLVAGRFDPGKALRMIQQTFGAIPKPARKLPQTYTREPNQDGERQVVVRRTGDTQLALVGYHLPAGSDPDFGPLAVLIQILADTPTGRLHKALVESKKAAATFGQPLQQREPSFLVLGFQARPEASLDECKDILLKTIEGQADFTPEEVERAKQQLLKEVDVVLRDADRVGESLGDYISMGDWRLFFLDRDRVKAATLADVQRVAKAYLKPSNRTLGLFIPEKTPDRAEIPEPRDVPSMVKDYQGQAQVALGEAFDVSPMAIEARTQRFTTPSGLRMALLPKKNRGASLNFRLVLRLGDEKSLQDKGLAGEFAARMLMRGTRTRSRTQIADALDRLGTKLRVRGTAEAVVVSGETSREHLPEVMKLVADILKEPAFPESEFDMLKQETLADIEASRTEPGALGQLALERHLSPYPKGHPRYVATLEEEAEAVKSADLGAVKAFHKAFYGASAAEFALVGDADPDAVRAQIEELLGHWASPVAFVRMPRGFKAAEPVRQVIQTPDKANAFFLAAQNLPLQTSDAEYPAMVLADYMLGGGFLNSRLAMRIRQKEGLSYSVGSDLQAAAREKAGQWLAYAILAPKQADKVETAFREELARVLKDGFTADEIRAAKSGWLQEQQLSRAQDPELVAQLGADLDTRRTMAYTAELETRIQALGGEDILTAMRRLLDPTRFSVVLAGDFPKAQ